MQYSVSEKTKRRLYNIAMTLFKEQGYTNTTVRQIAATAEVSTATVYRYFPNKSDFLSEIGFDSVDHLREYVKTLPNDMPMFDKVMSLLMEDVRGNLKVFYKQVEQDGSVCYEPNDIRPAYLNSYAIDLDHYNHEVESRRILADLYKDILDEGVVKGELVNCNDTHTLSRIITAVFFQEQENGSFAVSYPFEMALRRKMDVLFDGKLA